MATTGNGRKTRQAPKGRYAAPALEKAFEIIQLLAEHPNGASLAEISAQLGRSTGELFRIVIVLEHLGYLEKSPETDRYTVAYKILDLAYRATPAQNLTRVATPAMQELAREIGQSCHLVVPNGGAGLVLAREENPGIRGFALRVGAEIDLLQSVSGHVILAFVRPDQFERLFAAAKSKSGRRADRDELEASLDLVRERGFDLRSSPITHGVTDISYPVFGFQSNFVGALTIPFLELIDGSQKVGLEEARRCLAGTAAEISRMLGFQRS